MANPTPALNFIEGSIEGLAWVAEGSGVEGAKTLGYQAQIAGAKVPVFGTAVKTDSWWALASEVVGQARNQADC